MVLLVSFLVQSAKSDAWSKVFRPFWVLLWLVHTMILLVTSSYSIAQTYTLIVLVPTIAQNLQTW